MCFIESLYRPIQCGMIIYNFPFSLMHINLSPSFVFSVAQPRGIGRISTKKRQGPRREQKRQRRESKSTTPLEVSHNLLMDIKLWSCSTMNVNKIFNKISRGNMILPIHAIMPLFGNHNIQCRYLCPLAVSLNTNHSMMSPRTLITPAVLVLHPFGRLGMTIVCFQDTCSFFATDAISFLTKISHIIECSTFASSLSP